MGDFYRLLPRYLARSRAILELAEKESEVFILQSNPIIYLVTEWIETAYTSNSNKQNAVPHFECCIMLYVNTCGRTDNEY